MRQQELSELEQAASELRKALERVQRRTRKKTIGAITPDHFDDLVIALKFVEESMQTLNDAHPGDHPRVVQDMIQERSNMSGWETWTQLLLEQIEHSNAEEKRRIEPPVALKKAG